MARALTKVEKGVLGVFVGLGAVLGIRALVKGGPPSPPPPGMATLYAKVSNAQTGNPIGGVQITFNEYTGTTKSNGQCVIENITPGNYEITFYDPLGRYQTLVL